MARRSMGPRGRRVFAGISILVGLVASAFFGPSVLEKTRATKSWVEVPGEVIESRVVRNSSRRNKSNYELEVDYRYRFEDKEYTSDQVTVGWNWTFNRRGKAEARQQDFLPGAAVAVFVDPEAPASAVLERGGESAGWFTIGLGAIFLLFGIGLLLNERRRARLEAEALGDIER